MKPGRAKGELAWPTASSRRSSALALAACAVGPDYVAPDASATRRRPVPSPPARRASRRACSPATGGGSTTIRCSTASSPTRSPPTPTSASPSRASRGPAPLCAARGPIGCREAGVGAGASYGRLPEGQRAARRGPRGLAGRCRARRLLRGRSVRPGRPRGVEAARGDLAAAAADADAVRVIVAAETARAYADAASARRAARRWPTHIVELLDQSLDLTERRRGVGLATRAGHRPRSGRCATSAQAELPALAAERDAALFRLATLTGRAPAELPHAARRAHRAAARSASRSRSATAPPCSPVAPTFAPPSAASPPPPRGSASRPPISIRKISLGGSIGSTGNDIGDIFGGGPLRWLLGALISWDFPNQERGPRPHRRRRRPTAEARSPPSTARCSVRWKDRDRALSLRPCARTPHRAQVGAPRAEQRPDHPRPAARRRHRLASQLLDAERTFADAEAACARRTRRVARAGRRVPRLGGGWSA